MDRRFQNIIILFCLFFSVITFAQSPVSNTSKRDTSFTNYSTEQSLKKEYPFARLVPDSSTKTVTEKKGLEYCRTGQRKLLLDVFSPSVKAAEKRIGIMIIHGGGWRSGNRTQHYALAQRLAALGYVCFTPEYRLSTEAIYPAAVEDLRAALRWMHKNAGIYNIDTTKIAVAGFSAGGQLAALLGSTAHKKYSPGNNCHTTSSESVQAIIDMDGILAFIHPESGEGDDSKRTSAATAWFGASKTEKPEPWKQASALTHVSASTPPTLFINSSVERMRAGRTDYINLLTAYGIYSEAKTFEGAPHSFPLFHPWFDSTVQIINRFLDKVFSPRKNQSTIIVAQDGSGNYRSVQEAFNSIPANNHTPVTVYVRNGVYKEKLILDSTKAFVTVIGEDKFKTVITFHDHTGKVSPRGDTINTYTSHSFLSAANDFTARNITFENTAGFNAGQAVAIQILGDRSKFINCRFIGNQDVLFPSRAATRQYFENCYIEGTTDFIFGPSIAWFQNCHIHSKKNSHVTAASTPKEQAFGYVFNDCVLTGDTSLRNVSLGRPWRPYAHVVVMNSYIGPHIKAEGWANWNSTNNYLTTRYLEYRNFGPSSNPAQRISWSKQLSEEELKRYKIQNVLGNWNPQIDQR